MMMRLLKSAILCMGLLAAILLFGIDRAQAAEIKVTVTREGDSAPLQSATVEVKCEGGAFSQLTGDPATDGSGIVQAEPQAASDCDVVSSENIYFKISKIGHVTFETVIAQTYDPVSVLNEYTVDNIQFNLKVIVADELGTALVVGDNITLDGNIAALEDPVNSHIYYFDGSGASKPLQIVKDGYVSLQTTNNNFENITFTEPSQIVVTLGANGTCNTNEAITVSVECKGLEFGYIYDQIQTEASTNLSGVQLTAGASGTTCTESSGVWYCPVLIGDIGPGTYALQKDGYVSKSDNPVLGSPRGANSDPQVNLGAITGVQFGHKFITKDELGNNLTLTSATAGASSVSCTIVTNNVYCPVLLADDNTAANGLVGAKAGYVTSAAADVPLAGNRTIGSSAQQVTTMTSGNGLDFALRIDVVQNELGGNIMPTSGTPWTGSAGLTLASQAYSSNKWYLAASGTGNLAFVLDGYVQANITSSPTAASQTISTNDFIDVEFSHKITGIKDELGNNITPTSAVGGASNVACSVSGNVVYCPILLADDNAGGFIIVKNGYQTVEPSLAGNRTAHSDAQISSAVNLESYAFKFSHRIYVKNELNVDITPDGVTAGANNTVCTIDGFTAYCPIPADDDDDLSDGFVIAKDGYVTANVDLLYNRADNGDTTEDSRVQMDATNGLDFALKVTVTKQSDASALTGSTVTAGNAYGTSCVENGVSGIYYCPVPVDDVATTVSATKTGYTNSSGVFIDRSLATDPQRSIGVSMAAVVISSGGGGVPITGGANGFVTTPPITTPTTPTSPTTPEQAKVDIVSRIKSEAELIFSQTDPLNFYLNTGTESTLGLGAGERGASVSSFKEAFSRNPASSADWNDVLSIANGRWPIGVVKSVEARAYVNFRIVYGRSANMKNSTDVNALKMMGYGVMHKGPRDLTKERFAIARFIRTFGINPTIARHWNIIRAIAYSGVIR